MTDTSKSTLALIYAAHDVLERQWRQAASEATDPESVSTYLECADDLHEIGRHAVTATCEGCGRHQEVFVRGSRIINAVPEGWTQTGRSRLPSPGKSQQLAVWCRSCSKNPRRAPLAKPQETKHEEDLSRVDK